MGGGENEDDDGAPPLPPPCSQGEALGPWAARRAGEGVRVADRRRGLMQKRLRGCFYKNVRILEFLLLCVKINFSSRFYMKKM